MDGHELAEMRSRVRAVVAERFASDAGGHDLAHLDRVARLGERIAGAEDADRATVVLAAYCHDFHRLVEARSGYSQTHRSGDCEELVLEALAAADAAGHRDAAVLECVAFCDRYGFAGDDTEGTVEARVLRDADNLDAIGAVGIARAFAFGALLGEPLWAPDVASDGGYVPGRTSSVLHHFEEKLLRLRDDMLTASGRRIAEGRHEVTAAFVERFRDEWRGDDAEL